jgi:hypothetical protein
LLDFFDEAFRFFEARLDADDAGLREEEELRFVEEPRLDEEELFDEEPLDAEDDFEVERFAAEPFDEEALDDEPLDDEPLLDPLFVSRRFSAAASDAFFAAARFFSAVRSTLFAAPAAPFLPAAESFSWVAPLVLEGPVRRGEAFFVLDFGSSSLMVELDFFLSAPPVYLFTVAHAMRSASFSLAPRSSALSSMCSAMRFCFCV